MAPPGGDELSNYVQLQSCIYVSFLLVVGSARAWTIGVAGRRDDAVVSNVHLGNIKHDGGGSEPTNPSASNNDSDTLSRREVISRGLMLAKMDI